MTIRRRQSKIDAGHEHRLEGRRERYSAGAEDCEVRAAPAGSSAGLVQATPFVPSSCVGGRRWMLAVTLKSATTRRTNRAVTQMSPPAVSAIAHPIANVIALLSLKLVPWRRSLPEV